MVLNLNDCLISFEQMEDFYKQDEPNEKYSNLIKSIDLSQRKNKHHLEMINNNIKST